MLKIQKVKGKFSNYKNKEEATNALIKNECTNKILLSLILKLCRLLLYLRQIAKSLFCYT